MNTASDTRLDAFLSLQAVSENGADLYIEKSTQGYQEIVADNITDAARMGLRIANRGTNNGETAIVLENKNLEILQTILAAGDDYFFYDVTNDRDLFKYSATLNTIDFTDVQITSEGSDVLTKDNISNVVLALPAAGTTIPSNNSIQVSFDQVDEYDTLNVVIYQASDPVMMIPKSIPIQTIKFTGDSVTTHGIPTIINFDDIVNISVILTLNGYELTAVGSDRTFASATLKY